MMNHNELKQKALKKKSVQNEYDVLELEFSLLQAKLQAHRKESSKSRITVKAIA